MYTAGEAIVWTTALRLECAAWAALMARPLTPPGDVRCAIRRIVKSSKATSKFGDVTATKFLLHPLFSGCTNLPRLEKGKGGKRAAGVLEASIATAVDLGNEEDGAPLAKRSNSSLIEKNIYAMGALAVDPGRTRTTWSCTRLTWPGAPRPWC